MARASQTTIDVDGSDLGSQCRQRGRSVGGYRLAQAWSDTLQLGEIGQNSVLNGGGYTLEAEAATGKAYLGGAVGYVSNTSFKGIEVAFLPPPQKKLMWAE